jgi:hypothetical protein
VGEYVDSSEASPSVKGDPLTQSNMRLTKTHLLIYATRPDSEILMITTQNGEEEKEEEEE